MFSLAADALRRLLQHYDFYALLHDGVILVENLKKEFDDSSIGLAGAGFLFLDRDADMDRISEKHGAFESPVLNCRKGDPGRRSGKSCLHEKAVRIRKD